MPRPNKMAVANGICGKGIKRLVGSHEGDKRLIRRRARLKNNIKIDLEEVQYKYMGWF
jgi:hypothetical protein